MNNNNNENRNNYNDSYDMMRNSQTDFRTQGYEDISSNNVYSNSNNSNNGYSNPYTSGNAVNQRMAQPYTQEDTYNNVYSHSESTGYQNSTPNSVQPSNVYSSPISKEPKKKSGNGKFFAKVIVAALCFGIIAGTVMVGVNYAGSKLVGKQNSISSTSSNSSSSAVKTIDGTEVSTTYDVATVANNVMPAMVAINIKATETMQNPYSQFFGFGGYGGNDYQYEVEGSGSGIIISESDSELLIVTNNHVVDGATEINVVFIDEQSCPATVKGTDADHDLAVVSVKLSDIKDDTKKSIKIATLGDSDKIKLGQPAVAIGNALGYGQSVTVGYISALDREVQTTDNTMNLIQTDAAINPGNSGGALLDLNGNVIGINSAKYSDTDVEGMGYAIPISVAKPIIEDLMNNTHKAESERAYLGISGTDVTTSYSNAFGLPSGIYVSQVNSGSPAEKAGIKAGDVITSIGGREIKSMEGLQSQIQKYNIGDTIEVVLQRQQQNGGYTEKKVNVTLSSKAEAGIFEN